MSAFLIEVAFFIMILDRGVGYGTAGFDLILRNAGRKVWVGIA